MEIKIPLVSVVIPMFNSAKFIPQTLESLLYQTLTDFEVVVVDDCSADNSVEVVKSFSKRFSGRLRLIRLPQNTGTPGLPRNIGIQLARGKYIAFLDSDDLFTKTALEELSTLAEKFRVDVVQLQNNFILWEGKKKSVDESAFTDFAELTNPENFTTKSYRKEKLTEPTLEPDDISKRVIKWVKSPANSFWATCLLFCRRDFLIANQIAFSKMTTCEDAPFAFEALCSAKKFLNAPNIAYIVRPRVDSVSRDNSSTGDFFVKRIGALNDGFNEFERVMNKIKFFKKRPDYRYAVLQWFLNARIPITSKFYSKYQIFKLNELAKKKFHPDDASLAACLFDTLNIYRLKVAELRKIIKTLKQK